MTKGIGFRRKIKWDSINLTRYYSHMFLYSTCHIKEEMEKNPSLSRRWRITGERRIRRAVEKRKKIKTSLCSKEVVNLIIIFASDSVKFVRKDFVNESIQLTGNILMFACDFEFEKISKREKNVVVSFKEKRTRQILQFNSKSKTNWK